MNVETSRITLALLALPNSVAMAEADPALLDRLRRAVVIEEAGRDIIRTLAVSSMVRATEAMSLLRSDLSYFQQQEMLEVLFEIREATLRETFLPLSDEELDAHFVLLALQDASDPEVRRRERVLVRVLAERDPARAAELTHAIRPVDNREREFWGRLRLELFRHFQAKEPERAVQLMDEVSDGLPWFVTLMASPSPVGPLCLSLLERLLTVAFPARLTQEQLERLATRVGESALPERVAMLHALIRRVHFPMPNDRPRLLKHFLYVAREWGTEERRAVLAAAHKDALCYLHPEDRAKMLEYLAGVDASL